MFANKCVLYLKCTVYVYIKRDAENFFISNAEITQTMIFANIAKLTNIELRSF